MSPFAREGVQQTAAGASIDVATGAVAAPVLTVAAAHECASHGLRLCALGEMLNWLLPSPVDAGVYSFIGEGCLSWSCLVLSLLCTVL